MYNLIQKSSKSTIIMLKFILQKLDGLINISKSLQLPQLTNDPEQYRRITISFAVKFPIRLSCGSWQH